MQTTIQTHKFLTGFFPLQAEPVVIMGSAALVEVCRLQVLLSIIAHVVRVSLALFILVLSDIFLYKPQFLMPSCLVFVTIIALSAFQIASDFG